MYVEIVSADITLPHLASDTFISSDKQIYRALVKGGKKVKLSAYTHYRRMRSEAITVFIPNLDTKWKGQLYATAACPLKKPLIVTTKQETG